MNSTALTVNICREVYLVQTQNDKALGDKFYSQPEINILALVQCHVYAQTLKVMMKGAGFRFVVLAVQPFHTANMPSVLQERQASGWNCACWKLPHAGKQ